MPEIVETDPTVRYRELVATNTEISVVVQLVEQQIEHLTKLISQGSGESFPGELPVTEHAKLRNVLRKYLSELRFTPDMDAPKDTRQYPQFITRDDLKQQVFSLLDSVQENYTLEFDRQDETDGALYYRTKTPDGEEEYGYIEVKLNIPHGAHVELGIKQIIY